MHFVIIDVVRKYLCGALENCTSEKLLLCGAEAVNEQEIAVNFYNTASVFLLLVFPSGKAMKRGKKKQRKVCFCYVFFHTKNAVLPISENYPFWCSVFGGAKVFFGAKMLETRLKCAWNRLKTI